MLHGNIARLPLAGIANGDVVYLDAIGVVVRRLRRDNPFVDARCYCECLDVGARFVWRGDGVVVERGDAFDRLEVGWIVSGEVGHSQDLTILWVHYDGTDIGSATALGSIDERLLHPRLDVAIDRQYHIGPILSRLVDICPANG